MKLSTWILAIGVFGVLGTLFAPLFVAILIDEQFFTPREMLDGSPMDPQKRREYWAVKEKTLLYRVMTVVDAWLDRLTRTSGCA